jgi:hypothetical protein
MGPMSKTLSEYCSTLGEVLRYEPTHEFTKKLLAALGLEWREEPTWSLPLKLRHSGIDEYELVDSDDAVILVLEEIEDEEIAILQRILTAANAELLRSSQSPATPLFWRQGDNPK